MAVTEALARGHPGGDDGRRGPARGGRVGARRLPSGLLFPVDDARALAEHLEQWLGDADLRERLRSSAAGRATTLGTWAGRPEVAEVLAEHACR